MRSTALPGHRAQKIAALDGAWSARRAASATRSAGSSGCSATAASREEAPLPEVEPWAAQEQLQKEKEALGFFLTGHPLDRYRDLIR